MEAPTELDRAFVRRIARTQYKTLKIQIFKF